MSTAPSLVVVVTTFVCSAALTSVIVTADSRPRHTRLGDNFVTDQYVTVEVDDSIAPEPVPAASARPRSSPSLASRVSNLWRRVMPAEVRTSRRSFTVESPATFRRRVGGTAALPGKTEGVGASTSVTATVGCDFSIEDTDGGYWDWTWDARLVDPNDNQIKSSQNFVSDKPGTGGSITQQLTDPEEGTYTCRITWWVQSYELGTSVATQSLTYRVPTGEQTFPNAWSGLIPTAFKWRGVLDGGSFVGRQVKEFNGGNDVDTCWWSGSMFSSATGLSGGDWPVGAGSEYGDDTVGWHFDVVAYYRGRLRAPCQFETDQIMKINKGSQWASYVTNRLKSGFTNTTVWSQRGNAIPASKDY